MTQLTDEFLQTVRRSIQVHGQSVVGVTEVPKFYYTVGNCCLSLPELLLVGHFRHEDATKLLNDLGEQMRKNRKPLSGDVSLGGAFPVKVFPAREEVKERYTHVVTAALRHLDYTVLQVVAPDTTGKFPGTPGCDPLFDVPVYGELP